MLDTIFIGTSGLLNHAKGLRVVGNNLANVNTPGFKSSQLQFANLFESNGGAPGQSDGSGRLTQTGSGLSSLGAQINFRAGLEQGTGNPLDLAISGNGFYTVKRGDEILYTRAGDFSFTDKGVLVNNAGDRVQSLDASGRLADITLDGLDNSLPKATSTVTIDGTLRANPAAGSADAGLAGVAVLDANGIDHPISLSFHKEADNSFTVTVKDKANATVGSGVIKFEGGKAIAGSDVLTFNYAPEGATGFDVKLDMTGVDFLDLATSLNVTKQDGHAAGVKTGQTIGADGELSAQYSNGESVKGARLAMADFQTEAALEEIGGSTFRKAGSASVQYGYAGDSVFGTLVAGRREGSNVDLAEEFGNLILMQRGYQASSHVISTANDMIQQLFDMKGNR